MTAMLFDKSIAEPATFNAPIRRVEVGYPLRDYQAEDADVVEVHWNLGFLHVLDVQATGLGKSVMAAELAKRKPDGAIAMIVVDSTDLAYDLFDTVKHHTGRKPGLITGDFKEGPDRDIVVATKQCLCAGDRYRYLDLTNVERLIIDECESALANEYLLMINHFIEQNPNLRICGLTATPLPAGDRAITDVFPNVATEPGPLYRDLQWAYLNGWLVKPMQGVLRCALDFTSLKVSKPKDGEEPDYSDKAIAELMLQQDERQWLELAGGIYKIAKGHTAIVVCPNDTRVADKLAGYIEGHARRHDERGVAYSIHRNLGKRLSWDLMKRYKAGEFPIAVSVRMFEKGFDYDRVNMVIMARRTKSLRLYTQIAGRGTRPLKEIRPALNAETDPENRRQIIAESAKPSCVIVDCLGINDDAKNILGVIDILGRGVRDDVKERVRRMMLDRVREQQEREQAEDEEQEQTPEPAGRDVGDDARTAVRQLQEEWEKRARVSADVDVSYDVGKSTKAKPVRVEAIERGDCSPKQAALLIAMGVHPQTALACGKKKAGAMISSYKERGVQADWELVREWERHNGRIA